MSCATECTRHTLRCYSCASAIMISAWPRNPGEKHRRLQNKSGDLNKNTHPPNAKHSILYVGFNHLKASLPLSMILHLPNLGSPTPANADPYYFLFLVFLPSSFLSFFWCVLLNFALLLVKKKIADGVLWRSVRSGLL